MTFLKNTAQPCRLAYSEKQENSRELAIRLAEQIEAACAVKLRVVPEGDDLTNVILFGDAAHSILPEELPVEGEPVYFSDEIGEAYVIYSNDRFGMAVAAQLLIERLLGNERVAKPQGEAPAWHRVSALEKDKFYKDAVLLGRKLYGTYGSWLQKQLTVMDRADLDDIALIDALIRRMGDDTLVLLVGSSSALYRGFVTKLSTVDYGIVTKLSAEGHLLIAKEFAEKYFQDCELKTVNDYADITDVCDQSSAYRVFLNAEGVAVVTPSDAISYEKPMAEVNGYTNAQYLARMKAFFSNPVLPEPSSNVEQTRREVLYSQFGTEYVFDYTEHTYDNYYSPAILSATQETGEKILYIAHEISKLRNHQEVDTCTVLKRSVDGGDTWELLGTVEAMRWATLLELNGKIYLEGNQRANGNAQIAVYDPADQSLRWAELDLPVWGSAPCAAAVVKDRIFFAHNGAVISASIHGDLLKTESWTVSNNPNQVLTREMYERRTGKKTDPEKRFFLEEGNVIVGADGQLYAMYRIDATPTWGHATIFRLSEDGTTLSLIESCNSVIDFPSNQSKFMIKRDPKTGLYVTLPSLPTADFTHQRNVLGLVVSPDLFHWRVAEVLLVDRQMMNTRLSVYSHAFQYVDFIFDGDDILFIVRESVGDTCTYHDGTCVTLYTIKNYADRIVDKI